MKKFRVSFTYIVFSFLFSLGASFSQNVLASVDGSRSEVLVTMALVDKPLGLALEELSAKTGYKIIIEKDFQSIVISGNFKDVSVEEFIRRALRGKNLSIISDESKKLVIVRLFGNKAGVGNLIVIGNFEDGPGSTLTSDELSDIKKLHKAQSEEFKDWKNNPESIDPYSGATLGELASLHEGQVKEYEAWKANPDSVDPDGGGNLKDISNLQEKQVQDYEAWKNNPESIDPYSEEKLGNLNAMHQQQAEEYESWKKDPEAIDPYSGERLGVLQKLHEQQEKDLAAKWGRK